MHLKPLSPFGTPHSIDAARVATLPLAMKGEAVRLLEEMELVPEQVRAISGLSAEDIREARKCGPFRRGGEDAPVGDRA